MNLRRRLALSYYRLTGGFPANIGGRRYRLVPEDRKFWRRVARRQWEPQTFTILERCLRADSVYLDVGAWIGPTVLFAAQRCQTVYCIEPDPVGYERLLANLRLNDIRNVRPFHGALSAATGTLEITNEEGFGNSETRTRPGATGGQPQVLAMDIARFIRWWGITKIDLLKMDIEGAEFALIPSLIELLPRIKPVIHLSVHAPLFPQPERHEKLTAIIELAGHYAFCYDKRLETIQPREILTPSFTDKFSEVLLTDTAL